jgi:hypothetical protein
MPAARLRCFAAGMGCQRDDGICWLPTAAVASGPSISGIWRRDPR